MSPTDDVRTWVERLVIGLDLCPFAAGARRGTAYVAVEAETVEGVLHAVVDHALDLSTRPGHTTLLVLTRLARDFDDFLDLVEIAEAVLTDAALEQTIQLAHFHPDYAFEGEDEITALTNRAPWPVLHLLRVEDVAEAIRRHPDPEGIPTRNQQTMRALGLDGVRQLLR